uniref:5'-3' exoribonuclease 1 n=1 Tax=Petromyzon marinus TaxID=7757 RepID=A0AAJ7TEK3_PETMA|nr:5'-3' exoribonuclease 1 isoform X2 [Petromyzon marinus]
MGVPKFYRWVSERYPCLSEVVKEHQIPEFDNLYLDMNGIIHTCSHPDDTDVHLRIPEEKIFSDIFHYIEVLFRIIKPRKVFFMAVDGVAPRAKMNQQRGRRFRSAKEAEDKIKKAIEKGEVLPTEERFDSNCITPGTFFMARLQERLKSFVSDKLDTDRLWHGVTVYLSGHETPGEGEHKIMEFIRAQKIRADHDPNTRHCLYGLDADLIMLGLTSHEPHFSLLREEVRFGGKKSQKRSVAPEETTFHLLHLSLMREYLQYEFEELKALLPFPFSVEHVIDDWVLMGFLVGNDFIPNLPNLHIAQDALPLLYRTYIKVLPTLDGYINESGILNLPRFEKYLDALSKFDREHFNEVYVDLKWFEGKTGNREKEKDDASRLPPEVHMGMGNPPARDGVSASQIPEDRERDELFELEFAHYKRNYYMTKMEVEAVTDDFLAKQALCYVEAIQWILHYYYNGVASWGWFYPYHYAPFVSDVRGISKLELKLNLGQPFLPYQQLLAVLPSLSKQLLPQAYQSLVSDETSPLHDFYPKDFNTDLNGKQHEWEAVVLVPFICEKRLLEAMQSCEHLLTEEERQRNVHSACLEYLSNRTPRCVEVPMDAWHVKTRRPQTEYSTPTLFYPGFPTLKQIPHKFYFKKAGVTVFQHKSRGESIILEVLPKNNEMATEELAATLLGRPVFVNWPHLEEALVVAVADFKIKLSVQGEGAVDIKRVQLSKEEEKNVRKDMLAITEQYMNRKGVVVATSGCVLYAHPLVSRRYVFTQRGCATLQRQWAANASPFMLHTSLKDICTPEVAASHSKTLEEIFPLNSTVFMLGTPHYGCQGEILDSSDIIREGRIRVMFTVPYEPNLQPVIQNQHSFAVRYSPGYVLANRLAISGHVLSRITGTLLVAKGSRKCPKGDQKCNLGLNLKFNRKNEEVSGYTKRVENEWLYSAATELLLGQYVERFPELFKYLASNSQSDMFYEDEIWSSEEENSSERVHEVLDWLKSLPASSASRSSCDTQVLDAGVVERLEQEVDAHKAKKNKKKVKISVKPHLLFRPEEALGYVIPDPQAKFQLFDRVVNVRESFSVPLGLRGTLIGIHGAEREADILYEVLFDEEFVGGLTIRCTSGRAYRLPPSALVNLSHGTRGSFELLGPNVGKLATAPQPLHIGNDLRGTRKTPTNQPLAVLTSAGRLNHSPTSPFLPTNDGFVSLWEKLQDIKPGNNTNEAELSKPNISILARPVQSAPQPQPQPAQGLSSEFQKLLSSLKVGENESSHQKPQQDSGPGPTPNDLDTHLFVQKGTETLMQLLKIDKQPARDAKANTGPGDRLGAGAVPAAAHPAAAAKPEPDTASASYRPPLLPNVPRMGPPQPLQQMIAGQSFPCNMYQPMRMQGLQPPTTSLQAFTLPHSQPYFHPMPWQPIISSPQQRYHLQAINQPPFHMRFAPPNHAIPHQQPRMMTAANQKLPHQHTQAYSSGRKTMPQVFTQPPQQFSTNQNAAAGFGFSNQSAPHQTKRLQANEPAASAHLSQFVPLQVYRQQVTHSNPLQAANPTAHAHPQPLKASPQAAELRPEVVPAVVVHTGTAVCALAQPDSEDAPPAGASESLSSAASTATLAKEEQEGAQPPQLPKDCIAATSKKRRARKPANLAVNFGGQMPK